MSFTFVMPCVDETAAGEFAGLLTDEGVQVSGSLDRYVHIPWGGDPAVAFWLAELAFSNGYSYDSEAASAAHAALRESCAC